MSVGCIAAFFVASPALAHRARQASAVLSRQLVVPAENVLASGQQAVASEEAERQSPAGVAEQEASETEFERLSGRAAEAVDNEAFPGAVKEPAGGPPALPSDQKITGFRSPTVASVAIGQNARGVIESALPLAVESGPGDLTPLDLYPTLTQEQFVPQTPLVPVELPKGVAEGFRLPHIGIRLVPVDPQEQPLNGAAGVIDGASVVYANTATDADTVAKATTYGLQADTVLRSQASPETLSYHLMLPAGLAARQGSGTADPIEITDAGAVVAGVASPSATDAVGRTVPVHMSLKGDVIALQVVRAAGEFTYPILVDPTVSEYSVPCRGGAWAFYNAEGPLFECSGGIQTRAGNKQAFTATEYAYMYDLTKGLSQIYSAKVTEARFDGEPYFRAALYIASAAGREGSTAAITNSFSGISAETCTESGCSVPSESTVAGHKENGAFVQVSVAEPPPNPEWGSHLESNQQVSIVQYASPTITLDTTNPRIAESGPSSTMGGANPLYGGGQWIQSATGERALEGIFEAPRLDLTGTDPGIGVSGVEWKAPGTPGWEPYDGKAFFTGERRSQQCAGAQCEGCIGYSCTIAEPETTTLFGLPDGEDRIEARVLNATKAYAAATAIVKVDDTPPENLSLSGLPAGLEITNATDSQSHLSLAATATDGKTGTPSSGVASLSLLVDGKQVGTPSGSCSPGPCTANSSAWSLNTEELPAGPNTVTVEARDRAGNTTTKTYTLTIDAPTATVAGPAAVNPITGEVSLQVHDVSVSSPGAPLTVSRTYRSRHLNAGAAGPLGPDWQFSVGGGASIEMGSNEDAILTSTDGSKAIFTPGPHGEYVPPPGDTTMRLKYYSWNEFRLTVDGARTNFEPVAGGATNVYMPVVSEGTSGTSTTTFEYQTVEGVTEPVEALAPIPVGVSCAPKLTKGCRALTFNYATKTTSTGSAPAEWGDYKGRLTRVYFTAWDPNTGKKVVATVAQYAYDVTGRLRSEWNPEISPALKTAYGYDTAGHVTAIALSGQQPWLLAYGTAQEDQNTGRLLALLRPPASTPLAIESAPANATAPNLSTNSPAVGSKLTVAGNGSWSNSPLSYSYQWEDCNSSGGECAAIEGAVNQSYYPVPGDQGHRLLAQVTALNAGGATSALTAATSGTVAPGTPANTAPTPPNPGGNATWTLDYNVPVSGPNAPYSLGASDTAKWAQHDNPSTATAVFPPDEPMGWPAQDYRRASIHYMDQHDRTVNTATPSGGISTSEYNEYNDIVRALTPDNRASALAEGSHSGEIAETLDTKTTYTAEGSEITDTTGPLHTVTLSNGSQVKGRNIRHTSFDEGAPGGEHPGLATKTTEAALVNGAEEDKHTETIGYGGQNNLGWRLRKPTSRTVDPEGLDLVHTTLYDPNTGAVTETRSPASGKAGEESNYGLTAEFGKPGTKAGQFKEPTGITFNPTGELLVLDAGNSRVQQFTRAGKQTNEFGSAGSAPGQLAGPRSISFTGNNEAWIADTQNNRLEDISPTTGKSWAIVGNESSAEEQFYRIRTAEPEGVAANNRDEIWVADTGQNRLLGYHRAKTGHNYVFKRPTYTFEGGLNAPTALAFGAEEGILYVADTGNNRIVELKAPEGQTPAIIRTFNSAGTGAGLLKEPRGIAVDREGHLWVSDTGNNRLVEYTAEGVPIRTVGSTGTKEGQLKEPRSIAVGPENGIWVVDSGNDRVEAWTANGSGYEQPGSGHAHDTQIIYYTAEANAQNAKCGKKPTFAGLPCISQPTRQPEGSLPKLAVSKYTYNIWDETETTAETLGTSERLTTREFDASGRPAAETVNGSGNVGTSLPTTHFVYNASDGALEKEEASIEGVARATTSIMNSLGQVTSYTDADGNTTVTRYDVDGRRETTEDGKGTQTYAYDPQSGYLSGITDTALGTLTAKYDVEGNLLTESYPNGLTVHDSYDPTGQRVGLEDVKTSNCSTNCTWFTERLQPSIRGQWRSRTSTFGSEQYTYDNAERLTEVHDTPATEGCTVRVYTYDADTNMSSLTTRGPAPEGKCASTGGTTEKHTFDEADRLNDPGVTYNDAGAMTTVSAADAGSSALTASYFASGQTATVSQGGVARTYRLDPSGRVRDIVSSGESEGEMILHFQGPGGTTPAWSTEPSSGRWTRNISGISGGIAGIQTSSGPPVIELVNLHGDIIGRASLSETAKGPEQLGEPTTEYGAPRTAGAAGKYSWLGGDGVRTELASGAVAAGPRLYIPQIGRFLQTDPVEGGSANAYAYTYGDPVGTADPSGESTQGAPPAWAIEQGQQHAAEAVEERAAELAAARAEAERIAAENSTREAAEHAAWAAESVYWASGAAPAEGPPLPLGGYEGWAEQDALETGQYEILAVTGVTKHGEAASSGCGYSCYRHGGGFSHGEKIIYKCVVGGGGGYLAGLAKAAEKFSPAVAAISCVWAVIF